MRLCQAPITCNQSVFRTDRNTKNGYCRNHYFQYSTDIDKRSIAEKGLERALKSRQNVVEDESYKNIDDDLVYFHSLYIRMREADAKGMTNCFVCQKRLHFKDAHNSHYIDRIHKATRFLDKNCHVSCPSCNYLHNTNKTPYKTALEKEKQGITDFLEEQKLQVYKPTISDLKELLVEKKFKLKMVESKLKSPN